MDENIILKMVAPYLKDNELTYDNFDKIFEMLSLSEQYSVSDILRKNHIELVDYYQSTDDDSELPNDSSDEFILLYDEELFTDDNFDDFKSDGDINSVDSDKYLIVRDKITLSNRTLVSLIQKGDSQAKQDLCIKNRGLVDKYVTIFQKILRNKLDFEDLEQAGMIGMVKAAQRFDLDKGTEFSTYAVWWIKQAITREIQDNGYTIRIPVHMMEKINKVLRADSQLAQIPEYDKRMEMISLNTGIPVKEVKDCMRMHYQFIQATSLDLPIGEDEETPLGDIIPSEDDLSIEEIISQKAAREKIEEVLKTLSDREQKILRLRFGLDDGRERTLEEVGQLYNVTRERIRQIEEKAIRKLRQPSRINKLKDFLG